MLICFTLFGMAAAISYLWVPTLHAWWTSQQVHSLDELQPSRFNSWHVSAVAPPLRSKHQHASWAPYMDQNGRQVFPTASEAAYPELLCTRVACILKAEALKAGFAFPTTLADQLEAEPHAAKRQIFTTQPRGKRLRPLVSEFQAYKSFLFPLNAEPTIQQFLQTLPKGSRICHRTLTEGFFSGMTIWPKKPH